MSESPDPLESRRVTSPVHTSADGVFASAAPPTSQQTPKALANEASSDDVTSSPVSPKEFDVARLRRERGQRVPMYFERPLAEQANIDPIDEEEVYVAVMINNGRALALTTPVQTPDDEDLPTVDPDFALVEASGYALEEPEAYFDNIADILQAAEYGGWDPRDICRRALLQQRAIKTYGEAAAAHARPSLID